MVTSLRSASALTGAPILEDVFYTLEVAALMVGRTPNAISIVLHRHPDRFDAPHYQNRGKYEVRLVTAKDLQTLRALYPIYVKQKKALS